MKTWFIGDASGLENVPKWMIAVKMIAKCVHAIHGWGGPVLPTMKPKFWKIDWIYQDFLGFRDLIVQFPTKFEMLAPLKSATNFPNVVVRLSERWSPKTMAIFENACAALYKHTNKGKSD